MSPKSLSAWLIGLFFWAFSAMAEQTAAQAGAVPTSAYEIVDATSAQVMAVVMSAEAYADEDPERYYAEVEALLDPLIDYRGFSRSVMGAYASSRRYKSLDEAERAQLRDQLDRFTQVMRSSLVRTYSKGLLAFGGSRIEVVQSEDDVPGAKRVSVRQNVFAERDDPYVVFYQMGLDQSDQWKLRNVIIESVNLGEIYRDQFQASAREENGDLDAVIAKWTVVTVDVEA